MVLPTAYPDTRVADFAAAMEQFDSDLYQIAMKELATGEFKLDKQLNDLTAPGALESVNVKFLGAKGDGVTDDSDAIQRAVDAAALSRMRVFFPPGTYIITKTIVLRDKVEVFGAGANSIVKLGDGGNATLTGYVMPEIVAGATQRDMYAMFITDQDAATSDIYLHDFSIDGNSAGATSLEQSICGIGLYDTRNAIVQNVNIDDILKTQTSTEHTAMYRAIGLLMAKARDCWVRGGVYGDAGYETIGVRGDCDNMHIQDLLIQKDEATTYGRHGFQCSCPTGYQTRNVTLSNVMLRGRGAKAINHSCHDVIFDKVTAEEIYDTAGCVLQALEDAQRMVFSKCTVVPHPTLSTSSCTGIQVRATATATPTDILITGCKIDVGLAAIDVTGGINVRIVDNPIIDSAVRECISADAGDGELTDLHIERNKLVCSNAGNTRRPINVLNGDYIWIIDNKLVTPDRGIELNTVTKATVRDNDFTDVDAALVFDLTSAEYLATNNRGYKTENKGNATITAASQAITVNHGLDRWPSTAEIAVYPGASLGSANCFWVDTVNGTQFTIRTNVAPGSDVPFNWHVVASMR